MVIFENNNKNGITFVVVILVNNINKPNIMKKAVRIITQQDQETLIQYFKSKEPKCNFILDESTDLWEKEDIEIGSIWYLNIEGKLAFVETDEHLSYLNKQNYEIIEGVPSEFQLSAENSATVGE